MKPIETLMKYVSSDTRNVADYLSEERLNLIAEDVCTGYKIDDESRSDWLAVNQKAMEMMSGKEITSQMQKDFPIPDAAKVIYPLIQNAVIQLASMMIMHSVRNGKVAECTVLGNDEQIPIQDGSQTTLNQGNQQGNPQGQPQQQPPIRFIWKKAEKARRVSDFLNYELLIESDSWQEDEHRLCHIVAAWGVGFKEVYYDPATKKNCSELLSPEDVIINNNLYGSIDKARRITIRQYLTKNDIIEKQRTGYFLDMDIDTLVANHVDNPTRMNNAQERDPVIECLKQFCYIDLDDDGYAEPYCVYVAHVAKKVLGVFPAFTLEDIKLDEKSGEIYSIRPIINIVDRHLISNPEGKYYSQGLNHLLFHQNRSITTILRQLIDAGTLSNAASSTGFVSKSLKTRERTLRISMGQYIPVDLPQGTSIDQMIMNLPVKEPSQVLLQLLTLLVETAKESGFITELLTGQTEMQNVPATTILATIEQGTRAFKPVIQKMFRSLKREFKLWFDNYKKYLDKEKYVRFQDESFSVTQNDFDDSLDIMPVADPTMASEAHRFARDQVLIQLMQLQIPEQNRVESLTRIFTDLQYPNPQALISPPPPPPPDPKMVQAQLAVQQAPMKQHLESLKVQTQMLRAEADHRKVDLKEQEAGLKQNKQAVDTAKTVVDSHKEMADMMNQHAKVKIDAYKAQTERQEALDNAETERERNRILATKPAGSPSNSSNT